MRNCLYGRVFIMLLACALVITSSPSAYAQNTSPESHVVLGNNYIKEFVSVDDVSVVRYTYTNNTSVTTVTENGTSTVIHGELDYTALLRTLRARHSVATYDRLSGYTYTYMKTDTYTDYFTPDNATYATIFGIVSIALGKYNFTLGTITAVAAMIFSASSSPVETKMVSTLNWYCVTETVSGEFISYYCEYTTNVYTKNAAGNWVYIDSESGSMESLSIW